MTRARLMPWVAALGLALLAVLVYRPDRALPFDLWDFREFLPILHRHPGVLDGYDALLHYYLQQGRMNPLFYLTFAVQYGVFADWAWGWQLLRFALMLTDTLLLVWFARRIGIGWIGAALVGALFVVATPVVRGWVQLMAEPQVVLFLLVGAHAALGYREAAHWGRRATVILGGVLAAFLSKEIAGALGAAVVLLAVIGLDRPVRVAELRSRRNVVLMASALAVALAVGTMLLIVRSLPAATGYGMAYGAAPLSLARLGDNIASIVLPVHPNGLGLLALLYPANALALILLVGAAVMHRRAGGDPAGLVRALAWAAGVAVFGAVLYWPWPKFDSFYAMPFFLGPVLLLGAAVDRVARGSTARGAATGFAAALVVAYASISATRSTETAAASLHLNVTLSGFLSGLEASDTVVIAGPSEGPRRLPVGAAELRDYAIAMGAGDTLPAVIDRPCQSLPEASPRIVIVTYSYGCGAMQGGMIRLTAPYHWRDWLTFRRLEDTLTVDLAGEPIARWRQAH